MKIVIDTAERTLRMVDGGAETSLELYSKGAFEAISRCWVQVGWSLRYFANFSWLGHPVWQLPEDLMRLQEVVFRVRPDVIIETGVFHGGSLVFDATLCEAVGQGRVIGIDLHIDPHDRGALERHPLAKRISVIEGDSASNEVFERVSGSIRAEETVLVLLDSCHTKEHVARELELYSRLITPGSYIVVADGIMRDLTDVPGGDKAWVMDNPLAAADEFLKGHPEFVREQPSWLCHDGPLTENITYWTGGWLRKKQLTPSGVK